MNSSFTFFFYDSYLFILMMLGMSEIDILDISMGAKKYIYINDCVITSRKTWIKIKVAPDEGNSRNQTWHWTNDKIGLAVQTCLWVRVELMAW